MNWTTQILVPLALLGSGLAAGGLMIAARGGPLLLRLPAEQYVPVHQFLVTRFDPIMPIAILVGLLSNVGMALDTAPDRAAQALYVAGALLLLGTISVSLARNVPINRWVANLDPESLPENFDQLDRRGRWLRWNLVRTVLAITAFAVNVTAVGLLL